MENIAKFKNRNGDLIQLIDSEDGYVGMTGYYIGHMRIGGYNEDVNKIRFVDPSGGPMISVDQDLQEFFNDGKSRIVQEIEIGKYAITFKIA